MSPTQPSVQPFILITEPVNGAVVSNNQPIKVTGLGASLPGNLLTIQLKDQNGNVLNTQSAPLDGQGNWSTMLQVNVAAGTPATIIAFSTNPSNDFVVAQATVNVTLGAAPTATIPRPADRFAFQSHTARAFPDRDTASSADCYPGADQRSHARAYSACGVQLPLGGESDQRAGSRAQLPGDFAVQGIYRGGICRMQHLLCIRSIQ